MEIKLKSLLEAGCHFGHQVTRWNPKMKSYIFTARDKVHIFDLVKTKEGLEEAAEFIKQTVAKDGKIIFVGTKKQAKTVIKENALSVGMPYVSERWIGGTLTNWDHIKRNLDELKSLKTGQEEGKFKDLTKKERLLIDRKIFRLEDIFGGLVSLEKIPEGIFIVDIKKEIGAAKEARMRGVKVIAVVDTNSDPDLADIVIPANDDAAKSVKLVVDLITQSVKEGRAKPQKPKEEEKKEERLKDEKAGEKKTDKEEATKKVENLKAAKPKKVGKIKTAAKGKKTQKKEGK